MPHFLKWPTTPSVNTYTRLWPSRYFISRPMHLRSCRAHAIGTWRRPGGSLQLHACTWLGSRPTPPLPTGPGGSHQGVALMHVHQARRYESHEAFLAGAFLQDCSP